MSVKKVNLSEFAKELKQFSGEWTKDLRDAAARGVAKSIPLLVQNSPVDTGLYAQSWDMTVDEEKIILGNYAPHASIIEYGARPFTPPIAPLLEWAKRVLTNRTDPDTGKKVQTGQPETGYSSAVWALAKYTQKRIAERGIVPRHIMQNALPQIIENIKEEMRHLG